MPHFSNDGGSMFRHRRIFGVAAVIATCVALATPLSQATVYAAPHNSVASSQSVTAHLSGSLKQAVNRSPGRSGRASGARPLAGDGDLRYNGGPVQENPQVFLIFWGPTWSISDPATNDVVHFFNDFGHTRYDNIVSQYHDTVVSSIPNTLTLDDVYFDSSTPPTEKMHCSNLAIDDSSIVTEVDNAISARGWPNDPNNSTYFVYTPIGDVVWNPLVGCSFPGPVGNYCGYHGFSGVAYAAVPYVDTTFSGTGVGCHPNVQAEADPEGDALANVSAQEEMDAITDPRGTAWHDIANFEIADKCVSDYSGAPAGYTDLNSGGFFYLQTMYSNASHECVNTYDPDTVGAYIPGSTSYFCLRFQLTTGGCAVSIPFGTSGDIPVVGDWNNNNGYDSIGVYIPGNPSYFCLRVSNTSGPCDAAFPFGTSGDIPIVGDWTGKGYDTIGVYIPQYGFFCLRNSNSSGPCDISFTLGGPGDVPVVGDWTGEGFNTVGVYIPQYGFFCLRNSNSGGLCDISLNFGGIGDIPVTGDYTDLVTPHTELNIVNDTIGVWISSIGYFCLRNHNYTGPCDVATAFGSGSDIPLVGHWFDQGPGYWLDA
jgi:hypothetical protein